MDIYDSLSMDLHMQRAMRSQGGFWKLSVRRDFQEPMKMTWQHMQDLTPVSDVTHQPTENGFSVCVCSDGELGLALHSLHFHSASPVHPSVSKAKRSVCFSIQINREGPTTLVVKSYVWERARSSKTLPRQNSSLVFFQNDWHFSEPQ